MSTDFLSSYMLLNLNSLSFDEHKTTLYTSSITTFPLSLFIFELFIFSSSAFSSNFLEYLHNASKKHFLALAFLSPESALKYASLIMISGTRISIVDSIFRIPLFLLYLCSFFISSNSTCFATIIAAASSLLPPPVITTLSAPRLLNLTSGGGGLGFVITP